MNINVEICLFAWRKLNALGLTQKEVDTLRLSLHYAINKYGCMNVAKAMFDNWDRLMHTFDRLAFYTTYSEGEKRWCNRHFQRVYCLDFSSILNEAKHGD